MPIKLDFQADPSDYERGTEKVIAANQRITKSTDAVSKDAVQANDKIGDSATDAAQDVDRAADKMTDSIRDWSREGQRDAEDLGDSISDGVEAGSKEAERSLGDFSGKAGGLGEAAADAFSGEWSGVGQSVGQTVEEGLSVLGPLGAVAGLAAAAGISALFDSIQEGTENSKQRVSDMYEDMTESGNKFLSDGFMRKAIGAILDDAPDAIAKLSEAQSIATQTGSDLATVLRGLVGDTDAQATVEQNRADALNEAIAASERYVDASGTESAAILERIGDLQYLAGAFDQTNSEQNTAAERARILAQAMSDSAGSLADAADKAQWLKDKLAALPPSQTIRLDVDDSALEAAITRQQGRTISVNVEGQITRIGNQVW